MACLCFIVTLLVAGDFHIVAHFHIHTLYLGNHHAVAVGLTLGVLDTRNSGIGGGCFLLIHLANGTNLCIDGREMAPAAVTRNLFLRDGKGDTQLSQNGPLASGVPGGKFIRIPLLNSLPAAVMASRSTLSKAFS